MIKSDCLQRIKEIDLAEVVAKFITIQPKGHNFLGCCPFHQEKTPSFTVFPVKNNYKCFGCGASGDGIAFVMQHEKLTFFESCQYLAKEFNLAFEVEESNPKTKEQISELQAQERVLNYVIPVYEKMLFALPADHPVKQFLARKGFTDEIISKWRLGWAGEEWNTVTTPLIKMELWTAAEALGISRHSAKANKNYDAYRQRIIFPIFSKSGKAIGLGGRFIAITPEDEKADYPKYINPRECAIYNKSTVLYGLNNSMYHIRDLSKVYLVEGYADVISCVANEIENVVGTCGTAITDQQLKLLSRSADQAVLFLDNDPAGKKSADKVLPRLLQHGFTVEMAIYEGKDPNEYFTQNIDEVDSKPIPPPLTTDAIMHTARAWHDAANTIPEKSEAKQNILALLSHIQNDIYQNNYLDTIVKTFKWKAADTKKQFESVIANSTVIMGDLPDETTIKYADWVTDEQREEVLTNGYISVKRKRNGRPMVGYYTFSGTGKTEISNFIVTPLFRIEAGADSRYMSEIDNGYRSTVVDMPARIFPNYEQFQNVCVAMGGSFLIYGNRNQWLRIATDLLHKYPSCQEVTTLGWHKDGFFAYVDKCYIPGKGLVEYDNWGILEHNEQKYLVPTNSEVYKNLSGSSDPYENLRSLTYKQSPINLKQWGNKMHDVFGKKGTVAIAYCILSIFRDIIFEVDSNCPHLYGFGEPSSGKSKWAESITALFYFRRPAFNLNSGTDFSFNSYVGIFNNCPAHENEFDISVLRPEWFQQIKGWYDGEGRVRGKMGSKTSTETQHILSTVVLTGQKLVTEDDNSVVTRCIIEPFSTPNHTDAEKRKYNDLKDIEQVGINSILCEMLEFRKYFEVEYKNLFNATLSDWRLNRTTTVLLNQRILQNYAHMSTCYSIVCSKIGFAVPANEYNDYCYKEATKWSKFIRTSDTLSEFWRMLEFLVNQKMVIEDWDYKVEELLEVRTENAQNGTIKFTQPTKVIFVRINNMHKLFQIESRKRTGKEALSLDNLLHYFSSRVYYIGPVQSKRFNRFVDVNYTETVPDGFTSSKEVVRHDKKKEHKVTSCYAFLYDELGIDIATENEEN